MSTLRYLCDYWVIIDRIAEKLSEKPDWYKYRGQELGHLPAFIEQHYAKYVKV